MLKRFELRILLRVIFIFLTITTAALIIVKAQFVYLTIIIPVIIFQLIDFYRFNRKAQDEVEQFVESIHYRDFSRYFDEKHAPLELKPLRKGFNEINTTFKVISKEKETQYQYLQKILELVETGILSYEYKTGEIGWMNEAFKRMLGIPYLKTIHSLSRRDDLLYHEVLNLRPGDSKVISIAKENSMFKALLSGTAFQTDNKVYKLIAFQNVNEALDETEALAWQKLLSVMTHEIMNSITPISSLASTVNEMLKGDLGEKGPQIPPTAEVIQDIRGAVQTIEKRSQGLLHFVDAYRSLTRIPSPKFQILSLSELFARVEQLMRQRLYENGIALGLRIEPASLELTADPDLIEQVLINLILNASEALKGSTNPRIDVTAFIGDRGRVTLEVTDNGPGIPKDILDRIFVPFFTTKADGSGIGLSLSRQIMRLHGGIILASSEVGAHTTFTLRF